MTSQYNELSGQSVERLKALADGVFAVAMTLLVLDLRLPEGEADDNAALWHQLQHLGPQFAAYLLSFTMLGTFWLAQHTFLERCRRSDRMLSWATLSFLFFVSTLPFSASTLYWGNLLGLGVALGWQIFHADHQELVHDPTDLALVRHRLFLAQSLYAVAAASRSSARRPASSGWRSCSCSSSSPRGCRYGSDEPSVTGHGDCTANSLSAGRDAVQSHGACRTRLSPPRPDLHRLPDPWTPQSGADAPAPSRRAGLHRNLELWRRRCGAVT